MHINNNKIHGSHGFSDQVQSLHDFVQSIVGTLPPANHDGALTQGTLGNLMHESVDDKGNPLIHEIVQIGRDPGHLRHHANLKKNKHVSVSRSQKKECDFLKITHRHPVIHHTMAMVAAISPGGMQSHHHLVPPPIFAQVLRQVGQGAFGQPLELLHYLLTLFHGVETVHPKHNLNLHF